MSWKSLVTASLLCVVASPVFAAPSLSITSGGLNGDGNWVWNVAITPTATGTPLAAELGFTSNRNVINVTNPSPAVWDYANPGNQIFTWEVLTGTPLKPEGIQANCTGCTVTNTAPSGGVKQTVVNGTLNQIFAAMGSIDLTSGAATQFLTITSAGPIDTALTGSVTLSGAYTGSGRIAEVNGATASNFAGLTGVATRTAVAGDANLSDGVLGSSPAVTGADLAILAANLGQPGVKGWNLGDFNGSTGGVGEVSGADLAILASNLGKTNIAGSTGNLNVTSVPGGAGAGSAVPEPASMALLGLGVLAGLGLVRRRK
jgi:hypothetical protein